MPSQTRRGGETTGKSESGNELTTGRKPPLTGNRSHTQADQTPPSCSANTGPHTSTNSPEPTPPPPPLSVNAQLADISQMIKVLNSSVDSCRNSLNNKIDKLEQSIQDKLTVEMGNLRDYVDLNIGQVISKVDALEKKLNVIEEQQEVKSEYHTDTTIVVRGLSYEVDEDLQQKATTMLRRGLCIHDAPVVRAKRMRSYGNKPGVVMVQFQSLDDKRRVLKEKLKLRGSGDFGSVYLNPSHTHTERIMDMNFRTLLGKIPGCENMRLTAHGKLVTRDEDRRPRNRNNHEQVDSVENH